MRFCDGRADPEANSHLVGVPGMKETDSEQVGRGRTILAKRKSSFYANVQTDSSICQVYP